MASEVKDESNSAPSDVENITADEEMKDAGSKMKDGDKLKTESKESSDKEGSDEDNEDDEDEEDEEMKDAGSKMKDGDKVKSESEESSDEEGSCCCTCHDEDNEDDEDEEDEEMKDAGSKMKDGDKLKNESKERKRKRGSDEDNEDDEDEQGSFGFFKKFEQQKKHKYLGLTMMTLSPAILKDLKEHNANFRAVDHGVLVRRVVAGSLSDECGITPGDVITKVNVKEVYEASTIEEYLKEKDVSNLTIHIRILGQKNDERYITRIAFKPGDVIIKVNGKEVYEASSIEEYLKKQDVSYLSIQRCILRHI